MPNERFELDSGHVVDVAETSTGVGVFLIDRRLSGCIALEPTAREAMTSAVMVFESAALVLAQRLTKASENATEP